jgi:hypothetical protein
VAYDFAGRPRPPYVGTERETLDGWLDFHRATLLWLCDGLTDDQLTSRAVPPSSLTLLGLVRHLTDVERGWFLPFLGTYGGPLYSTEDDEEGEFHVTSADPATDLARYRSEVDVIREALRSHDLDEVEVDGDRSFSLRWVVTHLVEEYARHNGHGDLLREALDGRTGE